MIPFPVLFHVFGRIGLLSFGGPAAQIALMHKELVEDRDWLTEDQFLRALSFCMLLPGPEAMQLATYAGWRLRGIAGGLIGGLLFVTPGAVVITILALLYGQYGALDWVQSLFLGIKAAVVVIVIDALLKVGRKALTTRISWAIAAASFIGLFFLGIPFPIIIAAAALIGAARTPSQAPQTPTQRLNWKASLRVLLFGLLVWALPFAVLSGADPILRDIGLFFSWLAVVTFGGAYAVLAYMTQAVVADFGWLTTGQMMDALGLAETTPGPLILVTQFVGMVAAGKIGTGLSLAAGAMTLWVTFVPCFIWIFAGAPIIEWLESQPRLQAALSGITAAVVGVIGNLSIWFGAHVLFTEVRHIDAGAVQTIWPIMTSLDPTALGLALIAGILLLRFRLNLVWVLAISAGLGIGLDAL